MFMGDITDELQDELHDPSNEIWSLDQLERYVNDGIRSLWGGEIIYGRSAVNTSLTTLDDAYDYDLPDEIDLITRVDYGSSSAGWIQYTDWFQYGSKMYVELPLPGGYIVRLFGYAKYLPFVDKVELGTALASSGGTEVVLSGNISDFPAEGTIKIEDEEITYESITLETKTLNIAERGANGTDIAAHAASTTEAPVYVYPIHEYLNAETKQLLKYFALSEAMGSLLNNRSLFKKYATKLSDTAVEPEDIEAAINYWRVQFERRRAELGSPPPSQLRQGA